jgi:hypothetical protein
VEIGNLIGALSIRAPAIAVATICMSVLGAWTNAPAWLLYAPAIVVGSFALVLWATRELPRQMKTMKDLGFSRNRDWIAYELSWKGYPRGSIWLGFFCFLAVLLSLQSPYALLGFTGFALVVAWARANRRYPADGGTLKA